MNEEQVRLVGLTEENWYDCCQLEVTSEQAGFIEPNAVSIAQSKFTPSLVTRAIVHQDETAGFLMYNSEPEELGGHWVYRIMIDRKHQGNGIGKEATRLMIAEMEQLPEIRKIVVGYHPDNTGAHQLYASLGFKDEGDRFGREMAVVKRIKRDVKREEADSKVDR